MSSQVIDPGEEKMKTVCTHCGAERTIAVKHAGRKVKCKACGESFRTQKLDTDGDGLVEEPEDAKRAEIKRKAKELIAQNSSGVSPDSLLSDFKGSSVSKIVVFTVILHVIILGGSSIPWLISEFVQNPIELEKGEREKLALTDATMAIKDIAEKYGLEPADITNKFSKSGSRADKVSGQKAKPSKNTSKPSSNKPSKQTSEPTKSTTSKASDPDAKTSSNPTTSKKNSTEEEAFEFDLDGKGKSKVEKDLEKVEEGPEEFKFEEDF